MSTTPRRLASLAAVAAIAGSTLLAAPAHAVDGPQTRDDVVRGARPGPVTGNLLANDSWDGALTATLSDVSVSDAAYSTGACAGAPATPAVDWQPDGSIAVDFGSYSCAADSKVTRHASGTYTLSDSAGQTMLGQWSAEEYAPATPIASADDEFWARPYPETTSGPIAKTDAIRDGNGFWLPTGLNDTFGPESGAAYRFEVLGGPARGVLSNEGGDSGADGVTYVPASPDEADLGPVERTTLPNGTWFERRYTSVLTDTFTYRFCLADDCTAPATATAHYCQFVEVASGGPVIGGGVIAYTASSGPATQVDPTSLFAPDADLSALAGATLTVQPVNAEPGWSQVAVAGDGTLSHTISQPVDANPGAPSSSAHYRATWRDGSGNMVGRADLQFWRCSPPVNAAQADEVWAGVGQTLNLPLRTNDGEFTDNGCPLADGMVVQPDGSLTQIPAFFDQFHFGDVTDGALGDLSEAQLVDGIWRNPYTAGNVTGDDHASYAVCSGYPGVGCQDVPVTVHVSPAVEAVDDSASLDEPGTLSALPLLDNDTYNDITSTSPYAPDLRTAEVEIVETPAGVTATVNPDRTVDVTAAQAGTYDLTYRLRDFTGTDKATLRVTVGDTPPAPNPVAPDAVDDRASGEAGEPIDVPVLDNDRYAGAGQVVLRDVPAGVTATVAPDGSVRVVAPKSRRGETFAFTYRLTDDTGLSDTATVRVAIAPKVPNAITGGASELRGPEAPVAVEASSPNGLGWGVGAGAGLAVALGVALAMRRRSAP